MVLTMIVTFLIAWLPYAVLALRVTIYPYETIGPIASAAPAIFAKTSCIYNPVIYVGLNTQRSQQSGFTSGKLTTDRNLALRVLVERRREFRPGNMLAAYVDLKKAFDSVHLIFAESLEVLVMAQEALHEEAKPFGLEVFWLKTKVQQRKGEPLIQCVELRADEKIRRAATRKLNQRIFGLLSRDLVAAEGHSQKGRATNSSKKMISPAAARVNGIAVQFQVAGSVPEKVLPEITKSKIRSIHSDRINSANIQCWAAGGGQPRIETAYVDTTKGFPGFKDQEPYLASYSNVDHENQSISSWTGSTSKSAETLQGVQDTIGSKNPFGRIPVDQTIEETIKQRHPDTRGHKGFSPKGGAVARSPKEQWEEAPELKNQVKKKQTHAFLLHALHAAESGYKSVIITAEDTDVMVLCLGMCHKIPPTCSRSAGRRTGQDSWISPHFSRTLGGERGFDSLVGMHAFTGCDTVSAFAGRGKMTHTKQVKMDKHNQDAFHELGRSKEVSPELF
ncbi:Opsin-VA [Chionoecetes opilio]|uniref:Opsin-VA n=1 Tax=Chionoecetes opilio TaxID=41210 RepID=A0A8J4Y2D3_CHIOP|nr:Opsin-VA [Chionoecetes opilio]